MEIINPCPVMTALSVIGGKWKPIILWILRDDARRFGEMLRSIPPLTQKVLTQQLRELERDGLVRREVYPVIPPRVEYSLTEYGRSLRPVLKAIADWGEVHQQLQAERNGGTEQGGRSHDS